MDYKTLIEFKVDLKDYFYQSIKILSILVFFCTIFILSTRADLINNYKNEFTEMFLFFITILFFFSFFSIRLTNLTFKSKHSDIYLEISYLKYLFFKKIKLDLAENFKYSYLEEITSRNGKSFVLRMYYKDHLIIKRNNEFDGFSDIQIQEIIQNFEKYGVKNTI